MGTNEDDRTVSANSDQPTACIMVADDDNDMREEVARALRASGYGVILCESGEHLVEYLSQSVADPGSYRMPDAIVSDIRMRGLSGLQVLQFVQESDDLNIPMVLMTAFGDHKTHEEARRLGAVATFNKPFDADDLIIAVGCALEAGGVRSQR